VVASSGRVVVEIDEPAHGPQQLSIRPINLLTRP